MTKRRVTASRKGRHGEITGLEGPSFGFLSAKEIIEDLRVGKHTYFGREASYESAVWLSGGEGEETLVSTRDVLSRNNLNNLPDC